MVELCQKSIAAITSKTVDKDPETTPLSSGKRNPAKKSQRKEQQAEQVSQTFSSKFHY